MFVLAYLFWGVIALCALELCTREVVRTSLLAKAGLNLSAWTVVLIAAIAGAVASALRINRLAVLFAILFTAGVAFQLQLGARLQSDGFYYFAYLRSLAFDGDVNFTNDYKMLGLGDKAHLFNLTRTGHAHSAWTIGPAFVWAPFFAAGHAIAVVLNERDPNVSTYGISYPYRQAVCIAGLVYGLLACWFIWRLTAMFFDRRIAAAATALVVLGSFMLWYIVKEPSMTHAPSMAGGAAFIWYWAATRENRTLRHWGLLGLLTGFIALIRWQNALFALLPACDAVVALARAQRSNDAQGFRNTLIAGAVFMACFFIGFLPQMLAWKAIYGSFIAISPVGPQIRWWDPHLVDILWSSRNGLLSWSPVLYLAAIGLFMFAWMRPAIGVPALLSLVVMVYFNSCIQDWWGSAGFGGRRFDSTIAIFALGMAAVVQSSVRFTARRPALVLGAIAAFLIIWNVTLIKVAQDGHVRIGEPVSFGEAGAHQARAFHGWFGHPFTYPVSLLFAARNGLPVASYDLLSANRFLGDPTRPYGRVDIGVGDELLIGDGWHGQERDGSVTFRWAASPATVLVPLDRTAHLTVQIRAQAFNYPGAPPQSLNVYVNDTHVAMGLVVPPEWTTLEIGTEQRVWRSGVNRLRLEFSRATRPADVGVGGDPRPLAAAVDYLRIQIR